MALTYMPQGCTIVVDGFSEKTIATQVRTEFDDGYVRAFARTSAARVTRDVTIVCCDRDALHAFKCWWQDDLRNGTIWWLWKDPVSDKEVRARFAAGDFTVTPRNKILAGTKFEIRAQIESYQLNIN